jgi:hypothetical protein
MLWYFRHIILLVSFPFLLSLPFTELVGRSVSTTFTCIVDVPVLALGQDTESQLEVFLDFLSISPGQFRRLENLPFPNRSIFTESDHLTTLDAE